MKTRQAAACGFVVSMSRRRNANSPPASALGRQTGGHRGDAVGQPVEETAAGSASAQHIERDETARTTATPTPPPIMIQR